VIRDPFRKEAALPRFSLERRITVFVLLATVVVVGLVAARSIEVELIPRGYTEPFLTVWVPWRDAPPREVLEKLTEPLEEELSTVKGLDRVNSMSRTGAARIWLRFKQGTDMDLAYREVRDRIERARRTFPDDADRIYVFKHDSAGLPVYVLGVAVDPAVTDVYNLIQKQIVLPLERTDGVANVEVNGLEEKEILIELDRDRTEASGLNIYQMAQELGGDSFTLASGHVREGGRKLLLRSVARYADLEQLRNRPVAENVRLRDIATVRYEEPEKRYRVRAMSKPAYAIVVFKEGEANAREVCGRLKQVYTSFRDDPRLEAAEAIEIFNQGDVIDESLSTLLQSGAIGGLLAALVLYFFLRRLRVTMVVNLAVPLSLLVALTVMYFSGQSVNIISMLALMVCVGLLVDNSVVVSENIDRMYKTGLSRRDAAVRGAGEIGLAITMSTLTTVIVFLPVALVEGPGQFFLLRMAVPISVALLASLGVALIYIPLGTWLTLPPRIGGHAPPPGRAARALERAYGWTFGPLNRFYNRLLAAVLPRRLDLVLLLVAVFAVTGVAMQKAGLGFTDVQENEEAGFEIDVEMPDSYTLEETEQWFLAAEKVVENHREELGLEGWFLWHGKTRGELQGWFTTPRSTDLSPREVTEKVVDLLPQRPGMELHTGQESQVEDADHESTFQVTLNGEDVELLDQVADRLEEVFVKVPGVLGRREATEQAPNELGLVVDRERAERYGVNPSVVAGVVGYALRGQALPEYRDEGKEIPVRVRYQEEDRKTLTALESFQVPTEAGGAVPLSALTEASLLESPEAIFRRDKRISRRITLDLREGEEEQARRALGALMARIDLPEGISFSDRSPRADLDEDLAALRTALYISIVFIYLLMGLLFESFVLPLSIIFTIPLASLGVIWIHLTAGMDIDFLGAVGIVLLVGVVVNNGIVLIDYVNRLRAEGHGRSEALLMAADRRFRPIMMTAITTVGGMVPLALSGRMESGISYTSFALTLIGGMTTATLLTLLVVPVFYTLFDDLRTVLERATRRVLGAGRTRSLGELPD
jgi:HAE1 family hydrophobic/amphiphilic exporter-1